MSGEKSDIEKLIEKTKVYLEATKDARGTLVGAAPLEIELYNMATRMMHDLNGYLALLEDANGTYLKEFKK